VTDVARNGNLFALIQSRFPADMSHPFLQTINESVLTYQELDDGSAMMAGALCDLGANPGDRVVVQVEKSFEAVVLYLACLRAGLVYVPMNTAYTAAELQYFIDDAEPHVLVCRPESSHELAGIAGALNVTHTLTLGTDGTGSLLDKTAHCNPMTGVEVRTDEDIAAILYTSGTTGRSKGAMLSHGNLSSNALVLHELWGFVPGDVLLHALPIYHVHGLFVALHCALLNASSVWFLPKFEADQVVRLIPRSTVMMGVPTFYVRLLTHTAFDADLCRNIRLFVAGSAPLLSETFQAFADRTGHRILERYGMTEAGMITSNPYDNAGRLAGSVGYALPGTRARVCNDDGVEVAAGNVGTLEITGPNVFKGYWRNPEKTATEFRTDGYFITGDVAIMSHDRRVSIVGRAKDLIISGGFNVYPKEIELEIDTMEGVVESAVIGLPHRDFGEAVAAVVVLETSDSLQESDVIEALGSKLAKFKQPKRVFFVQGLPRNAMGKVQKNTLRDEYTYTFQT